MPRAGSQARCLRPGVEAAPASARASHSSEVALVRATVKAVGRSVAAGRARLDGLLAEDGESILRQIRQWPSTELPAGRRPRQSSPVVVVLGTPARPHRIGTASAAPGRARGRPKRGRGTALRLRPPASPGRILAASVAHRRCSASWATAAISRSAACSMCSRVSRPMRPASRARIASRSGRCDSSGFSTASHARYRCGR